MAELDINNVEEILVRFADGNEVIYKGKGLEKFRRLVSASPAYGEVKGRRPQAQTLIIDEYSDEEEEEEPIPVKSATKKKGKAKGKAKPSVGPNGYHTADLDYAPNVANKGRSPMDIAREMQRQAEQASGIKF